MKLAFGGLGGVCDANVGSAPASTPGHDVGSPSRELTANDGGFGIGNGEIIGALAVVFLGVKKPGAGNLLVIIQAALGGGPGFAVCGERECNPDQKEQNREDGNDFDGDKTARTFCSVNLHV